MMMISLGRTSAQAGRAVTVIPFNTTLNLLSSSLSLAPIIPTRKPLAKHPTQPNPALSLLVRAGAVTLSHVTRPPGRLDRVDVRDPTPRFHKVRVQPLSLSPRRSRTYCRAPCL